MKKVKNFLVEAIFFITDVMSLPLSVYAASITFYLVMSIVPILILLTFTVPAIGWGEQDVINVVTSFTPDFTDELAEQIIKEAFGKGGRIVSITTIVVIIWSAAMCMDALSSGFVVAYDVEKKPNFVIGKLLSIIYIILFVVAVTAMFVMMTVVDWLIDRSVIIEENLPHVYKLLINTKFIWGLMLGIMLVALLYRIVSGVKHIKGHHIPGAVFTMLGWTIFSYAFTFYLSLGNRYSTVYGSMATVMVFLMWVYFLLVIMLVGARLNLFIDRRKRDENTGGIDEKFNNS